ncbi:MAG: TRAP transporter small permease [Geminicoccaceae bacterium]|nr:TRAP transporter small permease [Geminicoccaceae bacterium]
MHSSLAAIHRVFSALATVALWISGLGLVLMTAFVAWQVWGRFVLNDSPSWTEPASVMLMAWFIFLGAAVGVREGYHLGFDVLLYAVPPAVAAAMKSLSDLVVLAFGVGMAVYGYQLTVRTWDATLPALGLPGGFDYMPLVGGGALVVLFSLERLARRFAGLENAPPEPMTEV